MRKENKQRAVSVLMMITAWFLFLWETAGVKEAAIGTIILVLIGLSVTMFIKSFL